MTGLAWFLDYASRAFNRRLFPLWLRPHDERTGPQKRSMRYGDTVVLEHEPNLTPGTLRRAGGTAGRGKAPS